MNPHISFNGVTATKDAMPRRGSLYGNCYATSEAAYHLLGGKARGWKPMVVRHEGGNHWFLRHRSGLVLDLTKRQFKTQPDYAKARGCGFLTKRPSRAARRMIRLMVWVDE